MGNNYMKDNSSQVVEDIKLKKLITTDEIGISRLFYRKEGWLYEVLWNTN